MRGFRYGAPAVLVLLACRPTIGAPVADDATSASDESETSGDGADQGDTTGGGTHPCPLPAAEYLVATDWVFASSDGCGLAMVLEPLVDVDQLTARWVDGSDLHPITSTAVALDRAAFGPGTDRLAYFERLDGIKRLVVRGQYGRGDPQLVATQAWNLDWSSDGRHVVYIRGEWKTSAHGEIGAFDSLTGEHTTLAQDGDLDMINVRGGAMVLEEAHSLPGGARVGLVKWAPYDGTPPVLLAEEANLVAAHRALGRVAWARGATLHVEFPHEAREPIELVVELPGQGGSGRVLHGAFSPDGKHLRIYWSDCSWFGGCYGLYGGGGGSILVEADPLEVVPVQLGCDHVVNIGTLCSPDDAEITYIDRFEGEDELLFEEQAVITPAGPGRFVVEVLHPEQPDIGEYKRAADLHILRFYDDGSFSLDLVAKRMRLNDFDELYPASDPQFAFTQSDGDGAQNVVLGVLDLQSLEHTTMPVERLPLAVLRNGQVLVAETAQGGISVGPMP